MEPAMSLQRVLPLVLLLAATMPSFAQSNLSTDQKQKMLAAFQQRFAAADKDGDGALTREEAKGMPRVSAHFDEIDANHDGKVTTTEILSFMAAQRNGQ
jgi:Ca2+-binding EF-hand superfamily protein